MPTEFKIECDLAGLFHAREPQFSQLFFHDFYAQELEKMVGQRQGSTVSRRGAQAFLKSGVRPESTCGLSNVWYEYVRRNRALFEGSDVPSPLGLSPPPILHLEEQRLSYLWETFQWREQHNTPLPKKKMQTVSASAELQDGISEFGDRPSAILSRFQRPSLIDDDDRQTVASQCVGRIAGQRNGTDHLRCSGGQYKLTGRGYAYCSLSSN